MLNDYIAIVLALAGPFAETFVDDCFAMAYLDDALVWC